MSRISKFRKTWVALAVGHTFAAPLEAATLIVDSPTDNGIGCTLREATQSINAGMDLLQGCGGSGFGVDDSIEFDPSLVAINPATIVLQNGELLIEKAVTISGLGQEQLFIDGNNTSRVFDIDGGEAVAISDMTIQNGSAGLNGTYGGGLRVEGANTSITVSNCTLTENQARSGGGIAMYGNLITGIILQSTISDNTTTSRGGGITALSNAQNTSLTISDSQISGNTASGSARGGGLFAFGSDTTIAGTRFYDNVGGAGGAIRAQNGALISVSDSIIRNNASNSGSAVLLDNSTVNIDTSSIYDNSQGTAFVLGGNYGPSLLTVSRSLISRNIASIRTNTNDSTVTLDSCTVTDHTVGTFGGAANVERGRFNAINSTFSRNLTVNNVTGGGGAIAAKNDSKVTLFNSTFSENTSANNGGQILLQDTASMNINNSLVSGGSAASMGSELYVAATATVTSKNSIWGDASKTSNMALFGFTADASDIVATSDSALPAALTDIILPLADNGGSLLTYLLAEDSPAINAGNATNCGVGLLIDLDQRGEPRVDGQCDIGSVELDEKPPEESFFVIPVDEDSSVIFSL